MIVKFKACGISRDVRKLARTPTLIIIKKLCMGIHKKFHEKNGEITLYFLFQDKPPINNVIKFYLT